MMPCARPRNALALGALAAGLACATAASAATLSTDARCYAVDAPLRLTADGLVPQAPLSVELDRQALSYPDGSTPVADAAGGFVGSFAAPPLPADGVQQRHVLAVDDGVHRPRTHFTVSLPPGADFQPPDGDPRRLRARFSVWGFALGSAQARARMPVWLHWVSPAGRARRSALLGRTSGACGALTAPPRRVFPFAPEAGRWLLVLDARRRYRMHADGPRAKISVTIRPAPR